VSAGSAAEFGVDAHGVWHDGGIGFRDNPRHVHLVDLGLRVRERFDDLAEVFQRWYPAFVTPAESAATEEFAA
jgi:hypothetical protein